MPDAMSRLPRLLAFLLPALLVGCASGEDTYYSASRLGSNAAQPFPTAYRAELVTFMRAYLNDPSGVRDAGITEPFQKDLGGLRRYTVCLRYDARDFNGRYAGATERAALFLDGRFDRMLDRPGDTCAGQAYTGFPELERLAR